MSHEIHRLLWNRKTHYRVHKIQPLGPILSQINPVQTLTHQFFKIHIIIISHLLLFSQMVSSLQNFWL